MGSFHNAHFPNLQTHKKDRAHKKDLLVISENVESATRKTCEHDAYTDGIHIASASNFIHCSQNKLQQVIIDIIDDCGVEAASFYFGEAERSCPTAFSMSK